jgi:hypothetical protein
MSDFEPVIIGFVCNTVFFFGAIFSAGFWSAKKKMGQKETSPSPARKPHDHFTRRKEEI